MEKSYTKMCEVLLDTTFIYFIGNDVNRAIDGIELRDDYEYEVGEVIDGLQSEECSLLEMFVKLADRCDDDVMYEPELGDRKSLWFWSMMSNLGLTEYDNTHFIYEDVADICSAFNERTYDYDGSNGGAFRVTDPEKPLYDVELWYQMQWWLNEEYPEY